MNQNITCITKACDNLRIPYQFLDDRQSAVNVDIEGQSFIFLMNRNPFNTQAIAKFCSHGIYTHMFLGQKVTVPKTQHFVNFNAKENYQVYVEYKSMEAILTRIESMFGYPLIIKRNTNRPNDNVFLCNTSLQITKALGDIFNRDSRVYQALALAQEYIPAVTQYRLVCFQGKPVLAYEHVLPDQTIPIESESLIEELMSFVSPVFHSFEIGFCRFNILRSEKEGLFLLRINPSIDLTHFTKDNGIDRLVSMYEEILRETQKRNRLWRQEK